MFFPFPLWKWCNDLTKWYTSYIDTSSSYISADQKSDLTILTNKEQQEHDWTRNGHLAVKRILINLKTIAGLVIPPRPWLDVRSLTAPPLDPPKRKILIIIRDAPLFQGTWQGAYNWHKVADTPDEESWFTVASLIEGKSLNKDQITVRWFGPEKGMGTWPFGKEWHLFEKNVWRGIWISFRLDQRGSIRGRGGRLNPKPAMLRGLVMGNFKLRFQPYKTLKAWRFALLSCGDLSLCRQTQEYSLTIAFGPEQQMKRQ